MGNYSKNPQAAFQDAVQKGYSRVRFQQGKPILDRELNLATDLAAPNRFLQQYVGSGVPEGSDGFNITNVDPFAQDFTIKAGRCIVNGFEAVLAADTTYRTQPHKENLVQWPTGASAVFLRVFTAEVNETQDADLKNAGDIGFETALRERVDWEVRVLSTSFSAPDHFLLASLNFTPGSGPPPPPPQDTSLASKSSTTTSSAISGTSAIIPPEDGGPTASVTDLRLKGLTLTKVRGDLDLLMNPARTALKDNIVTSTKIQDAAVTTTKLSDGSVTMQKLQDGAVIAQKIMDGNVSSTKITDGAITAQKIQDGAVSTQKLQDNSVSTQKIANGAITSTKFQDGAVTSAKIGANAVGFTNLNVTLSLNTSLTLGPSGSSTFATVIKANTGPNAFILVNVFGDGDYTWSEKVIKGDRAITVTNQSSVTITITVRVVFFLG